MGVKKEWTLLFFMAGDNELSPLMIAELKALKDAGFQLNTTVLAYFDPNPLGAPTRIYNVNRGRKAGATESVIGDGGDSFVPNLVVDAVSSDEIAAALGEEPEALDNPNEVDVGTALTRFLEFARKKHRADHYILFLHGHGSVVANDAFLPDSNPVSALTLKDLGDILGPFSEKVRAEDGEFELLAMHSCSMSSVEVAYQLKGTANFMIASEGSAFVGGWPYRKLLLEAFTEIEAGLRRGVPDLVEDLYHRSLFNGTDFMAAGHSSELALCSLQKERFKELTTSIAGLVRELKRGLQNPRVMQLILLAHWKSQSYWEESYTDFFDFCRCLSESCDLDDPLQKSISTACTAVSNGIKAVVERSEAFGPAYQYSHGLSVYFPWSRPIENVAQTRGASGDNRGILERYREDYLFTTDFEKDKELNGETWLSFLEAYFDATRRTSRAIEDKLNITHARELEAASRLFKPGGTLSASNPSVVAFATLNKPTATVGLSGECPSIKNYPQETEVIDGETRLRSTTFPITAGALRAFTKFSWKGNTSRRS